MGNIFGIKKSNKIVQDPNASIVSNYNAERSSLTEENSKDGKRKSPKNKKKRSSSPRKRKHKK